MFFEQSLTDNKKLDFIPAEIINNLKVPNSYNKDSLFPQKSKLTAQKLLSNDKLLKKSAFVDISAVRGDEIGKLDKSGEKALVPSLIGADFHVTKDEVKSYLEYEDHEPTAEEEIRQKLVLFPTEAPQSREEVQYLRSALDKMLDLAGRPDEQMDNYRIAAQDDIDGLVQLLRQLEHIYSVALHELARQIKTSCDSRGSVVFELRNKYTDLIRKVPEELLELKETVEDQVVKDKTLTQRIEDFQHAIKYLTEQLKEVKIRDIKVTENAESIHKEIESALKDSDRSKELLNDYHILYDLQRQRLENQMSVINNEKEEWCSLALALCLKISDESLLNTTKRLRLTTKKLFQQAQHFAIYISDCDTVLTSKIQDLSGECLKQITKIHAETSKTTNNFHDLFHFLKSKFEMLTKQNLNDTEYPFVIIANNLSSIKTSLSDESLDQIITDISLLNMANYQSINESIHKLINEWSMCVDKIANRKPMSDNDFPCNYEPIEFGEIFQTLQWWAMELSSRVALISTFIPFLQDLRSYLEKFEAKIAEIPEINKMENHPDDIWPVLSMLNDLYLEMFDNREFLSIEKIEDFIEFNDFYNTTQKSVVTFSHMIDMLDAVLLENINAQQSRMTDWIIDALFLLCNMGSSDDIEIKFKNFSESFGIIVNKNHTIVHYVIKWTERFSLSLDDDNKKFEMEEYKEESNRWVSVAEILIKTIGEKIEQELLNRRQKSEQEISKMSLEDIDKLIKKITEKTTDKNMFLAIGTVTNLRSEIRDTSARIATANEKRALLSGKMDEKQSKIRELEEKISELTTEYQDLVKTD